MEHTKVCALCSRTDRGVLQWTGERSQENKLNWYCKYCRFIYMLHYLLTKLFWSIQEYTIMTVH